MNIEAAGITIEVIRRRTKKLILAVKPDGTVKLTAPARVSKAMLTEFAQKNTDWIKGRLSSLDSRSYRAPLKLESGERLTIWGEEYTLSIVTGNSYSARICESIVVLSAPDRADNKRLEQAITELYRGLLKEEAAVLVPKWERITGLYCSSWQTKNMKTRWGTCNSDAGRIWLSIGLVAYPKECLEYVILHELTHLKHKNHGADFKAQLDNHMPNWREIKKTLRQ